MPTPVSSFSPFTPFTPATSAHGSGGYFDRPTPAMRNSASLLSRRPDFSSHNYSTSSSTRISRVSAPIDSPRLHAESGWRMASRLREEALTAWEQQVRSNTNINNITTLSSPCQFSAKLIQARTLRIGETPSDKARSTSSDRASQGSHASRPSLRLSLHIQQTLRKTHSESLVEQAALAKSLSPESTFRRPSTTAHSTTYGENASRV